MRFLLLVLVLGCATGQDLTVHVEQKVKKTEGLKILTQKSGGTGFFVGSRGYIMTAGHVVEAGTIWVYPFGPLRAPTPAAVIAVDLEADLALLKIGRRSPVKPRPFCKTVGIGDPVVLHAWRHPERETVYGLLAYEDEPDVFATSAEAAPGFSGAPAVNILKGCVAGVATHTLSLPGIGTIGSLVRRPQRSKIIMEALREHVPGCLD